MYIHTYIHTQDNPAEFDWFDKLNTVNAKGKVIDNLDGITACTIDC
jgi:hypothetical protein